MSGLGCGLFPVTFPSHSRWWLVGGAYHPEEIYSKYIVQVAGKGFTVVNHPSEVYGLPDTHECIDGFVEKVADRVGKPYSEFIDLGLYKSRFSLQLLGSAKEDRVKRPVISSIKEGYCKLKDYLVQPKLDASEIWPQTFSSEKLEKEVFQPIEDKTALNTGAGLVTAKFGWLEIGSIKKEFVNFQAKSYEACPICEIKHEKNQLYGFLRSNGCFILKCYWQKQYKSDHKELIFGKVIEISAKPKRGIVKRIEKLKDAPEVYPDFLGIEKTTTLIRSPPGTWKTTALREIIMALKDKVESLFRIEFSVRLFVAILDEANAIMRQISSSTNARESENAMRDVLRSVRHILAMNAFANKSTLAFLKIYRGEGIYIIDNRYQPRKNSNELFYPPGRENIRVELTSTRPNNNLLPAIKGHREWNNNTISYKVDESPAVITFIEVEHQKRLSARYFIEKLCSLIASTGASLQLIKMDER
ncbi:hypothetical protein RhiirB3_378570 [Rhizophagus irregularis]|nr:hypothetical protein RhiirB3_378570 [Rhizophagus irregularis]